MSKPLAENRKARFNYEILEKLEAGIALVGSEVKSLREGGGNLADAYAHFQRNELWLANLHIAHYKAANQFNHEPTRLRKLLLHRQELDRLLGKIQEKGLTLLPLTLYLKGGKVKVELGLGKGKKAHDKRDTIKQRESDRELKRVKKSLSKM
ncbi:MAG TPA: SsrA-binding protein SmpB [bacterium]|nr:SsrA-binding protein SmpB [bacterium]